MTFKNITRILEKYNRILAEHNSSLSERLLTQRQASYLREVLSAFSKLSSISDDMAAIQSCFSENVCAWQKKYEKSALAYLLAPLGEEGSPESPANDCLLELFQELFPEATIFKFLETFFYGENQCSSESLEQEFQKIVPRNAHQLIRLFHGFQSVEVYEKFMEFNSSAVRILWSMDALKVIFVHLDLSGKQCFISALLKRKLLLSLQAAWELILSVSDTPKEASQTFLQIWRVYSSQPGFSIGRIEDMATLSHLPAEEKVYELYQPLLCKLLSDGSAFGSLLKLVAQEVYPVLFEVFQNHLPTILKRPSDFSNLFWYLDSQQCVAVCHALSDLLKKVLVALTSTDRRHLVRRLKSESFLAICRACHTLSIPIVQSTKDLIELMQMLNDKQFHQRNALGLYDIFSENLPDSLNTMEDFLGIVQCIEIGKRVEFCQRDSVKVKFSGLVNSAEPLKCISSLESLLEEGGMNKVMEHFTIEQAKELLHSIERTGNCRMHDCVKLVKYFSFDISFQFCQLVVDSHLLRSTVKTFAELSEILRTVPDNMREKFFHDFFVCDFTLVGNAEELMILLSTFSDKEARDIFSALVFLANLKDDTRLLEILLNLPSDKKMELDAGYFTKQLKLVDDPKKWVILLSLLPEKTIADVWEHYKDVGVFSRILSAPDALAFLKMFQDSSLCNKGISVFCELFRPDLSTVIPTAQQLILFIKELLSQNLRVSPKHFFDLMRGINQSLKIIITDFEILKTVCDAFDILSSIFILKALDDCLCNLIKSTDQLIEFVAFFRSAPDSCNFIISVFLSKGLEKFSSLSTEQQTLFLKISNLSGFNRLMSCAKAEQRHEFYLLYRAQLAGAVENINDLFLVCQYLSIPQRNDFMRSYFKGLPALINSINNEDDFVNLCMSVNPDQYSLVFAGGMERLRRVPNEGRVLDAATIKKFFCMLAMCGVEQFQALFHDEDLLSRFITSIEDLYLLLQFGVLAAKRPETELQSIISIIFQSQFIKQHIKEAKNILCLLDSLRPLAYKVSLSFDTLWNQILEALGPGFLIKRCESVLSKRLNQRFEGFGRSWDDLGNVWSAVMRFLTPLLLGYFLQQIQQQIELDSDRTGSRFQNVVWSFGSLFEDVRKCNELRDRFLTLYRKDRHELSWFTRGKKEWQSLEPRSTSFFGKPQAKKLPTLRDVLFQAYMSTQPSRTMAVLQQLADELRDEFTAKYPCLSDDARPARAAP
jgi:hypothetical protein